MPTTRSWLLLPLGLLCASLAGQAPEPRPTQKTAEPEVRTSTPDSSNTEPAKPSNGCENHDSKFHPRNCNPPAHSNPFTLVFGAYAQGILPLRTLKEDLGQRTGFGLGVQWTENHGDWHASRTRLEWNTFPEGHSVEGTRTYAKNYLLSWDHLFMTNKGKSQAYFVAGIGGSRWNLEQTTGGIREARRATKLAVTGGVGLQFSQQLNLEARYVVSSVDQTFDANTLQMSLGWRF